jgi:hypothetical protein
LSSAGSAWSADRAGAHFPRAGKIMASRPTV